MINIRKKHHEGIIKNGQSRDTGNIGHKTQNENKQTGGEPTCSLR
jgi:hypothetical protein